MAATQPFNPANEFSAEVYRLAATERIGALQTLYDERFYTLGIYVSGVAVESVFRAYRHRLDPRFDARHDLHELARSSRFADALSVPQRERCAAALQTVALRWSNAHRYRSDAAMRAYLKRARFDRGIDGDFLKENARRVIVAATELVAIGNQRWKAK